MVTGFSTNKSRALLAYLAVEVDKPHRRQTLAGLLWPDYPERSARASLRSALANLRQVIGDIHEDQPYLHISRQMIQFNSMSTVWMDVSEFKSLLNSKNPAQPSIPRLEEAVELYLGGFLEGFSLADAVTFEDWALITRDQLERQMLTALHQLTAHYEARGEYDNALKFAWRLVNLDPWDEYAQRQLMRLLAFNGQRAAALTQYESMRSLLAEELAIEPVKETTRLYESIRNGELKVPEPSTGRFAHPVQLPMFLGNPTPVKVETPVFVAREHELSLFEERLESTLSEKGQVLFVTGDAGRGKTTLMQEFGRRMQKDHPDILVVEGTCNTQSGVGDPYLPFRQVISMLTGDVETRLMNGQLTTDHAKRLWAILPLTAQLLATVGLDLIDTFMAGSLLIDRVKEAVPVRTTWLNRLEQLVNYRASLRSTPELHQVDMLEQYAQVLIGVARQAPLIIILDDVQWADQGSISLLFHLGRKINKSRILLLCAYRPEDAVLEHMAPSPEHDHKSSLQLESVANELRRIYGDIMVDLSQQSREEGKQFVEALLASESNRLSKTFHQSLYEQTGGHPLYTVELLRMLQERGHLIVDDEGYWVEGADLEWKGLPPRVEAVIAKRVDRLSDDLRDVLSIASVEGEEFTAQVVMQDLDIPEREVLRILSGLEKRHRLIKERGEIHNNETVLTRYHFAHNLIQRYVYNELTQSERRLLHADIAATLEDLYAANIDQVTIQLAYHYSQTELKEKSWHYLTQAGHQARSGYASDEAIHYYSEALSLMPDDHPTRFDLFLARSKVYGLMADRKSQRADIYNLLAFAERSSDTHFQGEALVALADYYLETEPFLAREPLQKAREIALELNDPVLEAHALRRLAWAGRLGADFQTSRIYIDEAAARFKHAGLPGEAARCLLMLARRLPGSGEHFAELGLAEEALILSQQSGDLRQEAIALRHLAIAHLNQGQYQDALAFAKDALTKHREYGDRSEECNALDVLGVILAWHDRRNESEARLRQCLSLSEEIGSDWGVLGATFGLWNYWYIPQGEYQQFLMFSDGRLGKAQAAGREWLIGFFSWLKIVTLTDLGQYEEALGLLQSGPAGELRQGDQVSHVFALTEIGRSRAGLGDLIGAQRALEEALTLAESTGDPYLASWPLLIQADLTLTGDDQGDLNKGLEKAQRVIAVSRDLNEVRQLAEGLNLSARLHLAQGDLNQALKASKETIQLLENTPALPKPQSYWYTHSLVLREFKNKSEADEYLQFAHQRVKHVADNLKNSTLLHGWLENVRLNREILIEAQKSRLLD